MLTTILLAFIATILLAILYVLKKGINEILAGLSALSKQLKDLELKSDENDN